MNNNKYFSGVSFIILKITLINCLNFVENKNNIKYVNINENGNITLPRGIPVDQKKYKKIVDVDNKMMNFFIYTFLLIHFLMPANTHSRIFGQVRGVPLLPIRSKR